MKSSAAIALCCLVHSSMSMMVSSTSGAPAANNHGEPSDGIDVLKGRRVEPPTFRHTTKIARHTRRLESEAVSPTHDVPRTSTPTGFIPSRPTTNSLQQHNIQLEDSITQHSTGFTCTPPEIMGLCTAPDPKNPVDECTVVIGQPCPNGNVNEHCCLDLCGRKYCTAKGGGWWGTVAGTGTGTGNTSEAAAAASTKQPDETTGESSTVEDVIVVEITPSLAPSDVASELPSLSPMPSQIPTPNNDENSIIVVEDLIVSEAGITPSLSPSDVASEMPSYSQSPSQIPSPNNSENSKIIIVDDLIVSDGVRNVPSEIPSKMPSQMPLPNNGDINLEGQPFVVPLPDDVFFVPPPFDELSQHTLNNNDEQKVQLELHDMHDGSPTQSPNSNVQKTIEPTMLGTRTRQPTQPPIITITSLPTSPFPTYAPTQSIDTPSPVTAMLPTTDPPVAQTTIPETSSPTTLPPLPTLPPAPFFAPTAAPINNSGGGPTGSSSTASTDTTTDSSSSMSKSRKSRKTSKSSMRSGSSKSHKSSKSWSAKSGKPEKASSTTSSGVTSGDLRETTESTTTSVGTSKSSKIRNNKSSKRHKGKRRKRRHSQVENESTAIFDDENTTTATSSSSSSDGDLRGKSGKKS